MKHDKNWKAANKYFGDWEGEPFPPTLTPEQEYAKKKRAGEIGDAKEGAGCATIVVTLFFLFLFFFGNGTSFWNWQALFVFLGLWLCITFLWATATNVYRSLHPDRYKR